MERFDKIFKYLLDVEGGYSNDKYDKGGKTKYGIIESEARQHGYIGEMRYMPLEWAEKIYKKDYYDRFRLAEVNSDKISLSICDWCVNSGTTGIKKAQVALNNLGFKLVVDGKIGRNTIDALNEVKEEAFLNMYHALQRRFYHAIVQARPTQKVFLKGWLNRVDKKEKALKTIFN